MAVSVNAFYIIYTVLGFGPFVSACTVTHLSPYTGGEMYKMCETPHFSRFWHDGAGGGRRPAGHRFVRESQGTDNGTGRATGCQAGHRPSGATDPRPLRDRARHGLRAPGGTSGDEAPGLLHGGTGG